MSDLPKFKAQHVTTIDGVEYHEGDRIKYVFHITHGPHEEGEGVLRYDDEACAFLIDTWYSFTELQSVERVGSVYD